MKWVLGMAVALGSCLMVTPLLAAQAPAGSAAGQGKSDKKSKKGGAGSQQQQAAPQTEQQPSPPANGNAFPTDTSNVPIMPSKPDAGAGSYSESDSAAASSLPGDDEDPVHSPDQTGSDSSSVQEMGSTSNVSGLDSLLPKPGEDEPEKGRKKRGVIDEAPKETSQQDISVGKYYMDQKNWRAAQSRFQSALVLAPEDPEVYWGLAESARHLGKFADARANYQKVMEYDPGSRHAKDAEKALKEPEIANAKAETQ